ncbi:MAG TPA: hypothetical protein VJ820_01485, partial [Propionibacteriaceae bacterium]|nr:hypothetical protein [Propionibacteriaceae bacterium]
MHYLPRCRAAAIAGVILVGVWASAVVVRTSGATLTVQPDVWSSPEPSSRAGQPPPAKPASPPAVAQAQAGATFVGSDTCLGCHDEQQKGYTDTAHGRADHPRSPASAQGCESCHGPGSKHVDDPAVAGSILAFLK